MLKRKTIRLKTGRSKANPEVQKKLKTQRSRGDETGPDKARHGLPVVLTTDRGEGRTVVRLRRTAVHPLCSQNSSSFFTTVWFPTRFSVLSCYFVLTMGVFLALLRGRIHKKKNSLSLSKTPLKKKKEEEEW